MRPLRQFVGLGLESDGKLTCPPSETQDAGGSCSEHDAFVGFLGPERPLQGYEIAKEL